MLYRPDRTIGRGTIQLNLPRWRLQAACRNLDPKEAARIFFPDSGNRSTLHKRYCDTCPVKADCLEEGLALEGKAQVGIWGGMTHNQLERERRRRRGEPIPKRGPKPKYETIQHGTEMGYFQHRTRHVAMCDACLQAHNEQNRIRYAS